jgi:hypothetical protein
MFWTKVEGIGSLGMPSILSYLHVANFMKKIPTKKIIYSLAKEETNVFNFELDKFNLHMKHQVLKIFLFFLSFFILLIKKKTHMLALMLGPKCKNMW